MEESDYTRAQVEAWATHAAEEFIERMDETYAFLSDQITGYEIALQVIQKELERLKSHTGGAVKKSERETSGSAVGDARSNSGCTGASGATARKALVAAKAR